MIKLTKVDIHRYKCIETDQSFDVDDALTVLVGMNESGKTSILEAIDKANHFEADVEYDTTRDYPRKQKKAMDKSGEDPKAVTLHFKMDQKLQKEIEDDLGIKIENTCFSVTYKYSGKKNWAQISIDKKKVIERKINELGYTKELVGKLQGVKTEQEFKEFVASSEEYENLTELTPYFINTNNWDNPFEEYVMRTYLSPNIPKFMYYDDYYTLASRVDLDRIAGGNATEPSIKTAKALIELADIDIKKLISANDYEDLIAELEATQMIISDEIFKYWSTNTNLKMKFDVDKEEKSTGMGRTIVNHTLEIRVENQRSGVSLPLTNRSKGFNWFFSFLVWFKKIQENKDDTYILLLDEPGLNLHAKAQHDLLRFLEDLSKQYQIIYTTHSPFMVETEHLDRVRTVIEKTDGTHISDSVQEKDPNTLFPLQAALGYDIAQNLFVSKKNLLVEGIADLTYLTIMSSLLEEQGKIGLKADVTIVPTGGADKIVSFVSLLRANDLGIVCLLDTFKEQSAEARMKNMVRENIIKDKKILFYHDILGTEYADVEDMFTKSEYIQLYNGAFAKNVKEKELDKSKPILQQLNAFNHYTPANYMAKNVDKLKF